MDHLIRYSPLPVPSTHIIHSKLHPLFAEHLDSSSSSSNDDDNDDDNDHHHHHNYHPSNEERKMYLAAFLPASLAALSMAGAAAAVQCSEHTECTHYTGCGVDFRFPPGCGDGSSGSWGVRGEVSL